MPRPSTLPRPASELVLKTLRRHRAPMTAYALLESLRSSGIRSAPIVYRALKSLEDGGKVHKLHSKNSFIACNCDDDHSHSLSVLAICQTCDHVEELHDDGVIHHLEELRHLKLALPEHAVIELPVLCTACQPA